MKYYNEMINIYTLNSYYFLHIVKKIIIIIKKDVEEMIKNIYIYIRNQKEK